MGRRQVSSLFKLCGGGGGGGFGFFVCWGGRGGWGEGLKILSGCCWGMNIILHRILFIRFFDR